MTVSTVEPKRDEIINASLISSSGSNLYRQQDSFFFTVVRHGLNPIYFQHDCVFSIQIHKFIPYKSRLCIFIQHSTNVDPHEKTEPYEVTEPDIVIPLLHLSIAQYSDLKDPAARQSVINKESSPYPLSSSHLAQAISPNQQFTRYSSKLTNNSTKEQQISTHNSKVSRNTPVFVNINLNINSNSNSNSALDEQQPGNILETSGLLPVPGTHSTMSTILKKFQNYTTANDRYNGTSEGCSSLTLFSSLDGPHSDSVVTLESDPESINEFCDVIYQAQLSITSS